MPSMKFLKFTHLKISCLPVVFKIFSLWPLKTLNDTWTLLKNNRDHSLNKGYTHAKHEMLFEMLCLQADFKVHTASPLVVWTDLWPSQVKYQMHQSILFWDILLTRFSQFDLWWSQITFDLNQNYLNPSKLFKSPTQ